MSIAQNLYCFPFLWQLFLPLYGLLPLVFVVVGDPSLASYHETLINTSLSSILPRISYYADFPQGDFRPPTRISLKEPFGFLEALKHLGKNLQYSFENLLILPSSSFLHPGNLQLLLRNLRQDDQVKSFNYYWHGTNKSVFAVCDLYYISYAHIFM